MIKKNSTATFIFPNTFEDNYSALDWLYDRIETGLGTQLDLEVIESLNNSKIIIGEGWGNGYYDITFANLYDIDGNTPIRFSSISESHFKDIVEPKNAEMISITKDEFERLKSIENKFNQIKGLL